MLASSLVEQAPGQPVQGPVLSFLSVTGCVYIHNVCQYSCITHRVALYVAKQRNWFYVSILAAAEQGPLEWP